MPECDNCDSHVTQDFYRVFSDNDGTLHGCLECMSNSEATGGVFK